jgi:hypothetical protein
MATGLPSRESAELCGAESATVRALRVGLERVLVSPSSRATSNPRLVDAVAERGKAYRPVSEANKR